jgi:hypothetical protein
MKRVAIVGNSESLLNCDNGGYIDSCDRVIRFNRCVVDGYEQWVGSRYDIYMSPYFWVLPIRGETFFRQFNEFWFLMDPSVKKSWYQGPDIPETLERLDKSVIVFSRQQKKDLQLSMGLGEKNPSTGLCAIQLCRDILTDHEIILFGFDSYASGLYFESSDDTSMNWRNLGSRRRIRNHRDKEDNDWEKESKYISTLAAEGIVTVR